MPIFSKAAEGDIGFSVLQFGWGQGFGGDSTARFAAQLGLGYEAHTVYRRPLHLATLAMIGIGAARIVGHARHHGTEVLIPRSIIPAAMTLLARRYLPDARIVYDSDGFVADERVEFGDWDGQGMTYRAFRGVEALICRAADSVMTRSTHGAHILKQRIGPHLEEKDVYIVPNGKEPSDFHPGTASSRLRVREQLGVDDNAPLLIYVGSLGERYLPEQILRFYAEVRRRRPDSHLVMLTGHQELARGAAEKAGIPADCLTIRRVKPDAVPRYLATADLGISFRRATFSQRCVSPIKLAEYLLCGLPVIATTGVGDIDRQLSSSEGILVPDVSREILVDAAEDFLGRILPNRQAFRRQCRETGLRYFSLEKTARGYRDAIEAIQGESEYSLVNADRLDERSELRSVTPSPTLL